MTDREKNKKYVSEYRKRSGLMGAISIIIEGNLDDKNKIIAIKDLVESTVLTGRKGK